MPSLQQTEPSAAAEVRPPRSGERDEVLATIRATGLLPDEGLAEVADDLDGSLAERPGTTGLWLVDATPPGLAGVAYYAPERMTDGTWNLYLLAVHPQRQGQGRGAVLVRAVEDDLRRRRARLLIIETSGLPEFAGQRRFYGRLGYDESARINDFYEPGDDKMIFTKSLGSLDTSAGFSRP